MQRNNLTKKDLINSIYMQIGFSKNISEDLIEDFLIIIVKNLKKDWIQDFIMVQFLLVWILPLLKAMVELII